MTPAFSRKVGSVLSPGDIKENSRVKNSLDLREASALKKLKVLAKKRKVRWIRLAPPCRSFSRARRKDLFAKARRLRSSRFPFGLEPKTKLVKEANLLASRAAQLAALQMKANGWFSLENPARSYIWEYQPVKRLLDNPNVKLIFGVSACSTVSKRNLLGG